MKRGLPDDEGDAKRAASRAAREAVKALDALSHFCDVLLPEDAEEPILPPELREIIHNWLRELRAKKELAAVGLKPRSTALLFGPPGCGKTTLAWHIAMRLGVPLVSVRTESLVSKYVGDGERNIAALFEALASTKGQCVTLFDEIDSIAMKRDSVGGSSAGQGMIGMLNVMLRKVENFDGICIAATNREKEIDQALWRRFGIQIKIDMPGMEERFAIIKRYLSPFDMADEEIDLLVDLTEDASPALLRQLLEGIKRDLILWPGVTKTAVEAFGKIVGSVMPAPGLTLPQLWAGGVKELHGVTWPLARVAAS